MTQPGQSRLDAAIVALVAQDAHPGELTTPNLLHQGLLAYVSEVISQRMSAHDVEEQTPLWYLAQDIKTGLHAGLYGVVTEFLP